MAFTQADKEARKFESDPADSSKFVVKTKVENTDSDAVPVKLINTDANIDVEVSVPSTVSINDTTPIKVDITDANIDVNLTDLDSNNRLPVSVDNQPTVTVDSSTPVNVSVSNTSLNTNATITNSSLNTNATITNTELITRNKLLYSSADITALGSSTNVTEWTSALADGVLTKEFVDTYQSEFEQVTLFTHPNLGDGNKALKKITQYSTQNNGTVLESIDYRVVDWDKDNQIKGSVAISAGAVTSPTPGSGIHTVVTTLTVTDNTLGAVTLSLSGINASFYHLHEVETGTHSQTSLPFVQGRTYQIHAHSTFPSTSYNHSLTVTATGDVFGVTASVNIATSGTVSTPPSFANTYYLQESVSQSMQSLFSDISPRSDQKFCLSFWMKSSRFTTNAVTYGRRIFGNKGYHNDNDSSTTSNGFQFRQKTGDINTLECFFSSIYNGVNHYLVANFALPSSSSSSLSPANLNNQWVHVLINYDYDSTANSGAINRVIFTNACDVYINGTALNKTASTVFQSYYHSTVDIDHGINQGYWTTGSSIDGLVEQYDELAYWNNTSLTSSEIEKVYNTGNKVIDLANTTGLTAPNYWWRHEDSSNLNYETISQSNKGTITNATQTAY